MARLVLCLLALVGAAHGFVSFNNDYTLSYCQSSYEKQCECYSAGYSYEYVECYVENDITYLKVNEYCMEMDLMTCLMTEPYILALEGCWWEDALSMYMLETCDENTGGIVYSTYSDDQCTLDAQTVGTRHGWGSMALDYCDSTSETTST
mmetsp:Transcript_25465/g.78389  ORF Transcript_25465/g.78389 Transcript_25465/m.78389 type:complete len:150 (+) Transcript_25465:43-492(+)